MSNPRFLANNKKCNSSATKAQRHKEGVWVINLYQKSVMSVDSCQLSVAKDEKGGQFNWR